ncbi:hypothetical protein [Nocardia sp. NPDC049149]|uniref:hypothetical protein n=1 Tax=Nocardia sp. NPDC049149 TaxID=3364315 RepID=UPI00371B776E
MNRYAHFVGSLPPAVITSDTETMQWFAQRSRGLELRSIPCDLDPNWVVEYLQDRIEFDDAFTVARPGQYADYSDMRSYRIRPGRTLQPQHVAMHRRQRIDEIAAAFHELRQQCPQTANARLQISQPNPLDLAAFVFGGAAVTDGLPLGRALRHFGSILPAIHALPVFTEAVLDEMSQLIGAHGDTLVFQVESPIAQLAVVKAASLGTQALVARMVAWHLAGFLADAHEIGARTILHLCYGDHRHQELLAPRSLAPSVALLNALARILRKRDVPLPPAHIPCAYGAHPAPLNPRFYQPLRRLNPEWQVIAGVAAATDPEDSIRSLHLFEQALGRTASGVATACGLGRSTVEDAERAAATTIATAASHGTEQQVDSAHRHPN